MTEEKPLNDAATPNPAIDAVREMAQSVRRNVQKTIVGKSDAIDLSLIALLCGGHALIEDMPGTGKTTLAKAVATSLGCGFRRIQFTPDLVPSDVLGVNVFEPASGSFRFQVGPIFSHIVLADEINRASPRTQSALLEAMAERQESIDGETSALPAPFFVIATLNPVEMEGTFPLPEAQLDRFLLRFRIGYPEAEEEIEMLERFHRQSEPIELGPVATPEAVLAAQNAIDDVRVAANTRRYILAIVAATRTNARVQLGASPRASLGLQRAAQAKAALEGRNFVLPDDVKALADPVLSHRIVVDIGSELRGTEGSDVIAEILSEVPVPLETGT